MLPVATGELETAGGNWTTVRRNVALSRKRGTCVARFLTGMDLESAIVALNLAKNRVLAIPFMVHSGGVGHKRGMAAGRYCCKIAEFLLKQFKNFAKYANVTPAKLRIRHISFVKGKSLKKWIKCARGRAVASNRKMAHVFAKYSQI